MSQAAHIDLNERSALVEGERKFTSAELFGMYAGLFSDTPPSKTDYESLARRASSLRDWRSASQATPRRQRSRFARCTLVRKVAHFSLRWMNIP